MDEKRWKSEINKEVQEAKRKVESKIAKEEGEAEERLIDLLSLDTSIGACVGYLGWATVTVGYGCGYDEEAVQHDLETMIGVGREESAQRQAWCERLSP